MEEAANKIVDLSNDHGFISELEKQQIHEYATLGKAEEKGFNEGKKVVVKERNIEVARKSLEQGLDVNIISTISGLSIEEINKIDV